MAITLSDPCERMFHHGNLKEALINAALSAPDIERLSLRQLASEIGVTPAATYRHFRNREELLFEVARIGFGQLKKRFEACFDISVNPSDPKEAQHRLIRLGYAYLKFADDEPALWQLMFGSQVEGFRRLSSTHKEPRSYDYLPTALMGLYRTGVIQSKPNEQDTLFAWSTVHGLAALRIGLVPNTLTSITDLSKLIAERVIRSLDKSSKK